MLSLTTLFWFAALFSMLGAVQGGKNCKKVLKDVKIIPTYADRTTTADVKIIYGTKSEVNCGNEFSVFPSLNAPKTVTYDAHGKCENMSIIMFNPDLPFPKKTIYLHWFVANIPSSVMKNGYAGSVGSVIADYYPPILMTGNQRNTFCVYCQECYIEPSTCLNGPFSRLSVDPRDLAKEYNLGNPEACNFFYISFGTGLEKYPPFKQIAEMNKKLANKDMQKDNSTIS